MAEIAFRLTGAAGEYMESATVVEWLKRPGDALRAGEPLVVVETAKASTELPSPTDGALARIVAAPGSEIALNGLLAMIELRTDVAAPTPTLPQSLRSGGGSSVALRASVESSATGDADAAADSRATDDPSATGLPPPERSDWGRVGVGARSGFVLASPIARRLAKEGGVDIAAVAGSGPDGRVQERDVLAAVGMRRSEGRREAPIGYRKGMAKRMTASAAIPQFSVSLTVEGEAIDALVAQSKIDGAGITVNDVIMKATALALREVPRFNARWDGDAVLFHDRVHIGMAVATDHGLAVPVIRDVDKLSLRGIASASFRLRRRTLGRKLTAEDVGRAGFTVSNLGLLGAEEFVALLNPPEVGILAVGAFVMTPVVRDGAIVPRKIAKLTVTGDHRVVDGADAARLLVTLKMLLEAPNLHLLAPTPN